MPSTPIVHNRGHCEMNMLQLGHLASGVRYLIVVINFTTTNLSATRRTVLLWPPSTFEFFLMWTMFELLFPSSRLELLLPSNRLELLLMFTRLKVLEPLLLASTRLEVLVPSSSRKPPADATNKKAANCRQRLPADPCEQCIWANHDTWTNEMYTKTGKTTQLSSTCCVARIRAAWQKQKKIGNPFALTSHNKLSKQIVSTGTKQM